MPNPLFAVQPAANGVEFTNTCNRIEQGPLFQPRMTDDELLNAVVDTTTLTPRHTPWRSKAILQPLLESALPGKLYQVKTAKKMCVDGDEFPRWNIDYSTMVYVAPNGNCNFYSAADIAAGNLSRPLTHLNMAPLFGESTNVNANVNVTSTTRP